MIANLTYRDREIERRIRLLAGSSYSFRSRLKMKGTGSPRFIIDKASPTIEILLAKSNNTDYGNIELRPSGIMVGFKSGLSTFVLVIPYSKLKLTVEVNHIVISSVEDFVQFSRSQDLDTFLDKLISSKEAHEEIHS